MGCNQCLLISSLFVAANIQSYLILIKLLWTLWQLRCNTFKFFPCHIRVSSNVLSRRNTIVACPALFIGICTVFTTVLYLSLSPLVVFTARLFPYLLIVVQGLLYGISASVALLQLPCACLRQFFPRIVEVNQSLCWAINYFGIQYVTFVF